MQRPMWVALAVIGCTLVCAGGALAHDRESNNGVTVTVHVDPDDEPIATQPATLVVERVETKAKFSWATCRCTWEISDSSGAELYRGAARPRTQFVFPEAGAYQLTLAGRVKLTKTRWRGFEIDYAFRADPPRSS